jgi:hypothetical protein
MPDEPDVDVISSGRDRGDRRAPRGRLLAGLAAAVLIAGGIAFHVLSRPAGSAPPARAQLPPSPAALVAPAMLHGTPLRPGDAPAAQLFLGGENLQLLTVRPQSPVSSASVVPTTGNAQDPLGPDPAVQQIISVPGGVFVLVYSHGAAGLPDIGDVLFVPAYASGVGVSGAGAPGAGVSGAGAPRLIARADLMALAPGGRDVWVEQAGPPWGNGPAGSPAWLVGPDGRRLSAVRDLGRQALVAATAGALLVQDPGQQLALIDPATGRARPAGLPAGAIIAGTDASDVAWQASACPAQCPLHITDLRRGLDTQIALPAHTVINPDDSADFDPSGQRLALPLDTTDAQGAVTGTSVYVADLPARRLTEVPGGPIPVVALPAVPGAFPAGSSDVVCVHWSAAGPGLWIVTTDGLYYQAGLWTGQGPLRVLPPRSGLAYKFGIPGTGP